MIAAAILLIYAGTLRHNAILAIIPLLIAIPYAFGVHASRRVGFAVGIVGVGLVAILSWGVALFAQPTYPVTAVMLDDIIHTAPGEGAPVTRPVYDHIKSVCDSSTTEIMNSYVLCTTEGERALIRQKHDQIGRDWLHVVTSHPWSYLRYRIATFATFLFPDVNRMYVYQDGSIENELGITSNRYTVYALGTFINGFAKTNIPFVFQPWFWFAALLIIMYKVRKLKQRNERIVVQAVAVSGILYGLGYAVAVVATDYRYSYWMVLATCFCILTLCMLRFNR